MFHVFAKRTKILKIFPGRGEAGEAFSTLQNSFLIFSIFVFLATTRRYLRWNGIILCRLQLYNLCEQKLYQKRLRYMLSPNSRSQESYETEINVVEHHS